MISKEAATEASVFGVLYVQLSKGHLITDIVHSIKQDFIKNKHFLCCANSRNFYKNDKICVTKHNES